VIHNLVTIGLAPLIIGLITGSNLTHAFPMKYNYNLLFYLPQLLVQVLIVANTFTETLIHTNTIMYMNVLTQVVIETTTTTKVLASNMLVTSTVTRQLLF